MKKLFVLPALALGLLVGTQNVLANETSTSNMIVKVEQDKYIDLAVENLPQEVLDAIVRDFKGATISAAAATPMFPKTPFTASGIPVFTRPSTTIAMPTG